MCYWLIYYFKCSIVYSPFTVSTKGERLLIYVVLNSIKTTKYKGNLNYKVQSIFTVQRVLESYVTGLYFHKKEVLFIRN